MRLCHLHISVERQKQQPAPQGAGSQVAVQVRVGFIQQRRREVEPNLGTYIQANNTDQHGAYKDNASTNEFEGSLSLGGRLLSTKV
eukprot:363897-Chlamydomonas_euryale.AAC.18